MGLSLEAKAVGVLCLTVSLFGAGVYVHHEWTGRFEAGRLFERNEQTEKFNAYRKADAERITRIALQGKENADALQAARVADMAHESALRTAAYSDLTWLQQHPAAPVPSPSAAQADPALSAGGAGLVSDLQHRLDVEEDRSREVGNEAFRCRNALTDINKVRLGWINYGTTP